jgi:hypothetical protein
MMRMMKMMRMMRMMKMVRPSTPRLLQHNTIVGGIRHPGLYLLPE